MNHISIQQKRYENGKRIVFYFNWTSDRVYTHQKLFIFILYNPPSSKKMCRVLMLDAYFADGLLSKNIINMV